MSSSDPRDALHDIVHCLKGVFKQYDRAARKKAWKSLQTSKGSQEINQLLDSPNRPVTGLPRLLSFKEWLLRQ